VQVFGFVPITSYVSKKFISMKLIAIISLALLIWSCGGTIKNTNSLTDQTNQYIKDSLLPSFNDPKSYELVGMTFDSVTNHRDAQFQIDKLNSDLEIKKLKLEQQKLDERTDKLESTGTAGDKKILASDSNIQRLTSLQMSLINGEINEYKKTLAATDSISHVLIHVKYRGKNKMGALVLNDMTLRYDPLSKKIHYLNED
jgi:hypothetical protein